MNLRIQITNFLSYELNKELHEFSEANWGEHYDTSAQIKLNYFATPDLLVIGYYKNNIAGLVEIFFREINFAGKTISMGGIGGMVVDKKLRRRGFATQILKAAMKEMKTRKTNISMLCTDIKKLSGLYGKVGFVPLGRPYYFINKKGKEEKDEAGMIAPISSEKIFEEILNSKEKINVGVSNF